MAVLGVVELTTRVLHEIYPPTTKRSNVTIRDKILAFISLPFSAKDLRSFSGCALYMTIANRDRAKRNFMVGYRVSSLTSSSPIKNSFGCSFSGARAKVLGF